VVQNVLLSFFYACYLAKVIVAHDKKSVALEQHFCCARSEIELSKKRKRIEQEKKSIVQTFG
jgi:hypothetical protein